MKELDLSLNAAPLIVTSIYNLDINVFVLFRRCHWFLQTRNFSPHLIGWLVTIATSWHLGYLLWLPEVQETVGSSCCRAARLTSMGSTRGQMPPRWIWHVTASAFRVTSGNLL